MITMTQDKYDWTLKQYILWIEKMGESMNMSVIVKHSTDTKNKRSSTKKLLIKVEDCFTSIWGPGPNS